MPARVKKTKRGGKARYEMRWKPGAQIAIDPNVAKERYDYLRRKHGAVTADTLLNDGRKKSSPFHSHFVWDDTIAAEKYRRRQAQHLLGSLEIMVVYTHKDKPKETRTAFVRYLHAIGPKEEAKSNLPYGSAPNDYAPIATTGSSRLTRTIMIREAHRELLVWKQKYEHLKKFIRVVDAIDLLDLE